MKAYPLNIPLNQLPDDGRVYVNSGGLVFLYPARILGDTSSTCYAALADARWDAHPDDWTAGRLLAADLAGVEFAFLREGRLQALARTIWSHNARTVSTGQFYRWWAFVNDQADPAWIGAAAAVAAREVMTTLLFQHRHLVDAGPTAA